MHKLNRKQVLLGIGLAVLIAGLITSIAFNIIFALFPYQSYLQDTNEIYIMEAGILRNNLEFADGEELKITYDFDCDDYRVLIEEYQVDKISVEG